MLGGNQCVTLLNSNEFSTLVVPALCKAKICLFIANTSSVAKLFYFVKFNYPYCYFKP